MSPTSGTLAAARAALTEIEGTAQSLNMYSTESMRPATVELTVGARRRRVRAGAPDPVATVALLAHQDILLWREGRATAPLYERRADRGAGRDEGGELVELYQYEKLDLNQVADFLTRVDASLNPWTGVRCLSAAAKGGIPTAGPVLSEPLSGRKRRLLLVHGCFGGSDGMLQGMSRAPNAASFFKRVFEHYDEVLVFDHPTLSASPALNAIDLFRIITKAKGPLDIVAHGRAGLVTRWVLEGLAPGLAARPCRAVLVGSPLGGTSLASAARLRASLSVLTNLGMVLKAEQASPLVYQPLLAASLALLRIASSVASAPSPASGIDAAIAMIPGLAAQSRSAPNRDLARVRSLAQAKLPTYFFVRANFETTRPTWQFWRSFRQDPMAERGTDRVFPGTNDLMVDTGLMNELADPRGVPNGKAVPAARLHDFGTSDVVHHLNYFEQAATLDFIRERLTGK